MLVPPAFWKATGFVWLPVTVMGVKPTLAEVMTLAAAGSARSPAAARAE
jgi:hypothetical protein